MRNMERVILHSDINHCYAQIEEMKFPQLREVCMAVGGSERSRHGIILAKNDKAKECGVKTGESLREAFVKCPQLCIIPPNYEEYVYYSEKVKEIYQAYSDKVESFGLDEAWIDVSESTKLFGSGYEIATEIQKRVKDELGLSVSIGISYNKVFAKMGSDMKKNMGLVEITRTNFRDMLWPLPIEHLFYVGKATAKKLRQYSIVTIGELAQLPRVWLKEHFGKMGELVWWFANGQDISEVAFHNQKEEVKSIGNGITTPRDLCTFEEAKIVFYVLAESVASRLREQGLQGNVISISLRNKYLESITRQCKIDKATNLASEIMEHILLLLKENYDFHIPLRSVAVSISGIQYMECYRQLNLFVDEKNYQKQQRLEQVVDDNRKKYGFKKIQRCCMLIDQGLSDFQPQRDHVIHPESFF